MWHSGVKGSHIHTSEFIANQLLTMAPRIIAMKSCLAVVAMFAMLVQSVRADKWAGKQLVVLQREKGVHC